MDPKAAREAEEAARHEAFRARIRQLGESMTERAATPEYQANAHALAKEAEEAARIARPIARRSMGIPAGLDEILDGEPVETEALLATRDFMAQREKLVLLLAGELGRGKTVAGAYAVDRHGGRYGCVSDLIAGGFFKGEAFDALRLTRTLVLDELGMEPMDEKGWAESILYRLLDRRIGDGKRTILISNLNAAALRERYGTGSLSRLWDRLAANWTVAVLTGPSMRRVGAQPARVSQFDAW